TDVSKVTVRKSAGKYGCLLLSLSTIRNGRSATKVPYSSGGCRTIPTLLLAIAITLAAMIQPIASKHNISARRTLELPEPSAAIPLTTRSSAKRIAHAGLFTGTARDEA